MAAIGSLRRWLRSYWDQAGAKLMQNEGVEEETADYQRTTMRQYIDGESPSAPNVAKWLKLPPEEKIRHLEDAFPDQN